MDLGIAGRVALVTAASRGLGRAAALALSQEGCRVAVCARTETTLAEAAAAIEGTGGEVLAIAADVTDPAVPDRIVAETRAHFGALDILVANAGGPPRSSALAASDADLAAALEANLLTSVRLVRAAVPVMRKAGWGRICLITSYGVKQPIPNLALSNTARTGLWAWAKTASRELVDDGVTINLACPGPHATDRAIELGLTPPFGDPADFGRVVAFLCSEPAKFVTGVALQVDGGATLGLT